MAKKKAAQVRHEEGNLEALAETLRSVGISAEEVLRSAIEGEIAMGRLKGAIRPDDPKSMEQRLGDLGIRRDPSDRMFVWPARLLPWKALRSCPHAIFSPTLAAMVWYAKLAAVPRWSTDAADDEPRRGVNFEDTTPALAFLKQIGTALLPLLKGHPLQRRESAYAALVLAREIQAEAEALARGYPVRFATATGKPNREAVKRARATVASRTPTLLGGEPKRGEVRNGISVEALQKRIREARDAEPSLPWPEIMPDRRGKRRA